PYLRRRCTASTCRPHTRDRPGDAGSRRRRRGALTRGALLAAEGPSAGLVQEEGVEEAGRLLGVADGHDDVGLPVPGDPDSGTGAHDEAASTVEGDAQAP